MSSARMLAAAVAFGLAACAHTPSSDSQLYLPDVRQGMAVRMVSSDVVPDGYDDHIVVLIDRDILAQAYTSSYRAARPGYIPAAAYRRQPGARPSTDNAGASVSSGPSVTGPARRATSTPVHRSPGVRSHSNDR
ncbi:MAG: hypothetical protein HKO55_09445 [Gammaproteobacteria bacterium]|nr:hypothetical protein [Gammaproteobacteria bacterium]